MKNTRHITAFYALIQSLYWITYGLMINFAAAFLLEYGFSNGRIGAILGVSYALSACAQPLAASVFSRSGLRLSSIMGCVYIVIGLLAALILVLPVQGGALAALVVCTFMLQSCMQPSMNSLHRGYELTGVSVNFSFARGMGSAAYSVMCALVGQLLRRVSAKILPALYLSTIILLVICLFSFRSPSFAAEREQRRRREPILKRYPRFALFLIGLVCLATVHIFIDNFMLQIMQNLGGGSAEHGTAIAIAGITELPAMVFYAWLSRRTDGRNLLRLAGWVWAVKGVLTALSGSPLAIYGTELLQFVSYAFYVPATVDYISRTLDPQDFLKGQALSGTAFTLGSLAATFIGGWLLDAAGVSRALVIMQIFSIGGAVLFTIAIPRVKKGKAA
ncbi:MAG: MFS transporter [Clostridia bacterium]|nr:MFS transporter [Clostridia bacterium]